MILSKYWACGISTVFLYFWIVVTCLCVYRHVHDLLGSPLWHSFLQRLDSLPTGCCTVGVCAARVHAVWLQLASAFVWERAADFWDTSSLSRTPRELWLVFELHGALLNPHLWNHDGRVYSLFHSSFRNPLQRNHLDHLNGLQFYHLWHRDIHDLWWPFLITSICRCV